MISQDRPSPAPPSPAAAEPLPASPVDETRTGASGQDVQEAQFDYIDEAIEETMIASDPPAFTPETGIGPPRRD
jgi:hypothetical protein